MIPRQIVVQAIERNRPPRAPIFYANRDFDSSDTYSVPYRPAASFVERTPGLSEWGFVWRKIDATMGQPRQSPLADWGRAASYVPPDPFAPGRLEHVARQAAAYAGKFIILDMGITGFNVAMFLRGFESFITDLYEAPDRVEHVLDLVFNFEKGIIRQAAGLPVDALRFGDDWGTQRCLMIKPELWRDVFAPRYRAQFRLAHSLGLKVWFHTCGNVFSIIGDLIAAGADVIELLQPDIFGVETLGAAFGGQVCFACAVDHQRRAISGSQEEIAAYARLLQQHLGSQNGAFIGYIEDYSCLGMSEQNYQWIRQAFHSLPAYQW
jgi:uroporphyrinogen decarboxylase